MATLQDMVLPNIPALMAQGQQDAQAARQTRQVQQENALTLQAKQRAIAERDAVARVMQESQGDWEVALPRLRMVSPDLATKYEEHLTKERTARLASMKEAIALEKAQTERALALLRAIPKGDQTTYAALREPLTQLAPDLQGFLPEQYDADVIARIQTLGETALQHQERSSKSFDLLADGKLHQAAAMAFSAAQDAEDWQEAAEGLVEMGVPRAVVRQFGAWSPEAPQRALALGTTPDARADNARADAAQALDVQQAGETARHNQATEATARGTLAVAQGNLTERRREGTRAAAGDAGPLSAADTQLVEAILKNPTIYGDLTPSQKTKLAGALAARGFTGFGKSGGASAGAAKVGPDVNAIFGEIEALSGRINTTDGGPVSNATGWIRRSMGRGNLDNDVAEYESLIEGMIPMVARAVGHTGQLTQQDVDSVRELFPKVSDNQTLAKNKLARVKKLMGGGGAAAPPAAPAARPAPVRQPIPGIPGGVAELQPDGRWKRVQ